MFLALVVSLLFVQGVYAQKNPIVVETDIVSFRPDTDPQYYVATISVKVHNVSSTRQTVAMKDGFLGQSFGTQKRKITLDSAKKTSDSETVISTFRLRRAASAMQATYRVAVQDEIYDLPLIVPARRM